MTRALFRLILNQLLEGLGLGFLCFIPGTNPLPVTVMSARVRAVPRRGTLDVPPDWSSGHSARTQRHYCPRDLYVTATSDTVHAEHSATYCAPNMCRKSSDACINDTESTPSSVIRTSENDWRKSVRSASHMNGDYPEMKSHARTLALS